MRLSPVVDIGLDRVGRGRPALSQRRVGGYPIIGEVGLLFVLTLKPLFNIRSYGSALMIARFGLAVDDDRPQHLSDAAAQFRIAGREVGASGRRSVIGNRRRPRLEIGRAAEVLCDQRGADRLAVRPFDQTALRLIGEDGLPDSPQDGGVYHAAEHNRQYEEPEGGSQMR